MDILVGCGEELIVQLTECVPTVTVPRDLLERALVALSDDLYVRSLDVQHTVKTLRTYLT
jgi:hypothetical protein